MAEEKQSAPTSGKTYTMGDVAAHARPVQGDYNTVIEAVAGLPGGDALAEQFSALLKQIAASPDMDEDTRALAEAKTQAIAEGLTQAKESPGALRRALIDAKAWFGSSATWVGDRISGILKSEAAQKTLGTVTEAGVKAAIKSFTGGA